MNIPASGVITIVTILAIFSGLAAIVLFIHHLIKREKEFRKTEKAALDRYHEIIEKANKQAAEILEKATAASEKLVTQTRGTNENVSAELDKILREMAEKHIKTMADEVVTFKKEYEDKIMQMQQAVDQNTKFVIQNTQYNLNKNLEAFSKAMLDKTSSSAQMLDEKAKNLLIQAEKDIAGYKKSELEKIDKAILQLVQKTYQDLLGENIPAEINRDLVLKALEKSKKEGLFS